MDLVEVGSEWTDPYCPFTANVINSQARVAAERDTRGDNWPWYPRAVKHIDEAIDDINQGEAVICFLIGHSKESVQNVSDMLNVLAGRLKDASSSLKSPQLVMAHDDEDYTERVRGFLSLEEKPVFFCGMGGLTIVVTGCDSDLKIQTPFFIMFDTVPQNNNVTNRALKIGLLPGDNQVTSHDAT